MILEIIWGDMQVRVDVPSNGRSGPIRVGDEEIVCDCVRLPGGRYSLILNERVYDLAVEIESDFYTVSSPSGRHTVRLVDPRRLGSQAQPDQAQAGIQRLRAEMPGKVIRVLVQPGERVECDQGLLVLEAMKMQNEIRAPKNSVVKELAIREGMTVDLGDLLISLE